MNGNVNLYDTYKANEDGKRYRVTEVGNETVKLVKLNEYGSKKHAGGRPRIMTVADLFRDFTKVNLPPVKVSKIEPQKPKQEEVEEVGTPSENAAQIEKETVREITKANNSSEDLIEQNKILRAEILDLKKTISKLKQSHEAEVADLKDRIMEAEAEANAIRKSKDEILKDRVQYADALDNDSVAFEEILSLAETVQLVATASAKLAKQIIAKTEGRI